MFKSKQFNFDTNFQIMEALNQFIKQKLFRESQASNIQYFRDFFQCEEIFIKFGINFLKSSTTSETARKWEKHHFVAMKMATVVVVMLSIINFVISIVDQSIVLAIESSAAVGIFTLMLLKIHTVMIKNRGTLMEILEKLEFHFPTDAWNQHVFEVQNYLSTLKTFRKITIVIYSTIYIQLISVPFFQLFYRWITSSDFVIDLIIQCYIPFDYSNPLVYSIIYVIHAWMFLVNVLALFSNELLYFGLIIVLSMEFDILGHLISEIDPREGLECALTQMKMFIKIHQELIAIAEKLEDIFSMILFVNIFGMIYLICGTAFLSVSGISRYLLLKYFIGLITTSWNGYIQCYFGERLIQSSISVANGAYNSNWYDGSPEYKKLVYIVIARSQKLQKLSALKYVDVCLETYKWIINKAYSFYSVLTAIYSV
ncbi:hypothetical protein ACKWTF_013538 [Chironomus riparius]